MKTKFKHGSRAILKGEEVVIKISQKNFSTKQITYLLEDGRKVTEGELSRPTGSKLRNSKETPEVIEARRRYKEIFDSEVAASMKYNLEWMLKKIEEAEDENDDEVLTPWEVLNGLEGDSLLEFIELKKLEIDIADYESEEEVKVAIAQELEIEVPEVE